MSKKRIMKRSTATSMAGILIIDLIIINAAFLLSNFIMFHSLPISHAQYAFYAVFVSTVYLMSLVFERAVDIGEMNRVDRLFRVVYGTLLATLLIATIGFFDLTFQMPRSALILMWFFSTILMASVRMAIPVERDKTRTIIVGTNRIREVLNILKKSGKDVIGVIDDYHMAPIWNLPVLGRISNLRGIIGKYRITEVIVAFPKHMESKIFEVIVECQDRDVKLKALPDVYDVIISQRVAQDGLLDLTVHPIRGFDRILKRIMDIAVSSISLIISSPLVPFIALVIKLNTKGSVLYKQKRVSQFNRAFMLLKFRTMIHEIERQSGPVITDNKDDPRVTRVGRFLRKHYLDEIPQLYNILKGDMSIVGPRPERPMFSEKFKQSIKEWDKRLFLKPGITGIAQLDNISGLNPEEKIKCDLEYMRNYSLLLDVKIILRTIKKIVIGK